MNPLSESSLELIEKYLLGQLTKEEQTIFDQEAKNPRFQQAIQDQQALMNAFKAHGREEIIKEMNQWDKGSLAQNAWIKTPRTWLYMTVSLAAVISLIWLFYLPNKTTPASPEALFADHFSAFPNIISPTVRDGNSLFQNKDVAFGYYDEKKYAEAYRAFTAMPDSLRDSRIEFYRGIAALGSNQTDTALILFRQINQQPESRFYKEAAWYAALAHVKKRESQQAIEYLTWISENLPHPFEKESRELLKQLQN